MYYNNSTFPIFLFKLDFEEDNIENIISNVLFIVEQKSFEVDFANSIDKKNKQDLFSYLTLALPSLILSNKKFCSDIAFKNSSIKNDILLQQLSKIRLDINKIILILSKMENDPLCLSLNKVSLVKDLIVFVYQYVFIELSKIIISTSINGKDYFFDVKNDSKKVVKFIDTDSLGVDRTIAQTNFIESYKRSFGEEEQGTIRFIESELILMTKTINQKKRLNLIIEDNISLVNGISRKNKFLFNKDLFLNFSAKFFFPQLKSSSTEDLDIETAYFNFIKSISR